MLRYRLLCSCGSFSPAMLPLSTPRRQLSTLPPQTFPAVLPLSMLLTQPFSCCAAAFHAAPAAPNTAAAASLLPCCRFQCCCRSLFLLRCCFPCRAWPFLYYRQQLCRPVLTASAAPPEPRAHIPKHADNSSPAYISISAQAAARSPPAQSRAL